MSDETKPGQNLDSGKTIDEKVTSPEAAPKAGVERKDAPHLTAEQAQALLEAIRGDRLETLFRLMLATGLRRNTHSRCQKASSAACSASNSKASRPPSSRPRNIRPGGP